MGIQGAIAVGMALLALVAQQGWAAEPTAVNASDKVDKLAPTTTASSTETAVDKSGWPMMGMYITQLLAQGGLVAVSVVGLAAVVALIMPLFGIKYCQILGNCNDSYGYTNSVYQNDPNLYGAYPNSAYPTSNTYQKRSIDYVGPVLHMLKSAYDKYGQNVISNINKKTT